MSGWLLGIALFTSALNVNEPAERRVALLVSHPFGGDDLTPLRYTDNDVARMRDVLRMTGGFAERDIVVISAEDANKVRGAFNDLRERLRADKRPSLLLFYYSGHAKDGELRLGRSTLALTEVKRLLEQTQASFRIALLDACRVGSITRLKGAVKSEPVSIDVDDTTMQSGQVLITASSDDEDAQESDEIQGSFFTHYLTSGLRGAADLDRDGRVTLSEAYGFAYENTVSRTVATRGGTQHPTFRFDMRGAGDVTLARADAPTSGISFPKALGGEFVIFDVKRRVVVAELTKDTSESLRVAVAPGDYVVKKREVDHVRLGRLKVRDDNFVTVDVKAMEKVAFADDYAKGQTVSAQEVISGKLGVLLSAQLGAQGFLSAPIRDAYVPTLGLFKLSLDLRNAIRRNIGVRFDLGFGSSGEQGLAVTDPLLGDLGYRARVSLFTAGVGLTGDVPFTSWLRLSGVGRIGFIRVAREFTGAEAIPTQAFSTLTPGVEARLIARCTNWLEAGLGAGVHYMFFNGDESQSLAYVDGGLILTAVLR